jgi:hypothetical protein
LAGYVLEVTDDGRELVDALLSIARGDLPTLPAKDGVRPRKGQRVRPAEQLKAIELLLERGWGRALAQAGISVRVTGQVDHRLSLASWTIEELEALRDARDLLLASGYQPPELPAGGIVDGEVVDA